MATPSLGLELSLVHYNLDHQPCELGVLNYCLNFLIMCTARQGFIPNLEKTDLLKSLDRKVGEES